MDTIAWKRNFKECYIIRETQTTITIASNRTISRCSLTLKAYAINELRT